MRSVDYESCDMFNCLLKLPLCLNGGILKWPHVTNSLVASRCEASLWSELGFRLHVVSTQRPHSGRGETVYFAIQADETTDIRTHCQACATTLKLASDSQRPIRQLRKRLRDS